VIGRKQKKKEGGKSAFVLLMYLINFNFFRSLWSVEMCRPMQSLKTSWKSFCPQSVATKMQSQEKLTYNYFHFHNGKWAKPLHAKMHIVC